MSRSNNLESVFFPKKPKTKFLFFCLGLLLFSILQLIKSIVLSENTNLVVNKNFRFLPFIQFTDIVSYLVFCSIFFLIFFFIFLFINQKFLAGILILYLASAMSNFIDNFTHDGTVDYFQLELFNWKALFFNLDDIFIFVSFLILFIWIIRKFFSYYRVNS